MNRKKVTIRDLEFVVGNFERHFAKYYGVDESPLCLIREIFKIYREFTGRQNDEVDILIDRPEVLRSDIIRKYTGKEPNKELEEFYRTHKRKVNVVLKNLTAIKENGKCLNPQKLMLATAKRGTGEKTNYFVSLLEKTKDTGASYNAIPTNAISPNKNNIPAIFTTDTVIINPKTNIVIPKFLNYSGFSLSPENLVDHLFDGNIEVLKRFFAKDKMSNIRKYIKDNFGDDGIDHIVYLLESVQNDHNTHYHIINNLSYIISILGGKQYYNVLKNTSRKIKYFNETTFWAQSLALARIGFEEEGMDLIDNILAKTDIGKEALEGYLHYYLRYYNCKDYQGLTEIIKDKILNKSYVFATLDLLILYRLNIHHTELQDIFDELKVKYPDKRLGRIISDFEGKRNELQNITEITIKK